MYAVSARFLETLTGSHKAVARVRVLTSTQFGASPTGGTELPILAGDVKLTAASDIKGTAEITVPGDYWDLVQPYGAELFIERGVDFGDKTREYVPLGYYRIDDLDQQDAPHGPIRVSAADRAAQMLQNRVLSPYQVPAGTTHRTIFERLVNGRATPAGVVSTAGYGMFISTAVPILFSGYDPDTTTVPAGQVVEDSTYEFLAKLADDKECLLRFDELGQLRIEPRDRPSTTPSVYSIIPGRTGTLIRASRKVTRDGVYNIVSAYGSDPSAPTGYQIAYNNDQNSPLFWRGRFGAAPRYYASPVLRTDSAALAAAKTVLARYTGLPSNLGLFAVPNPALRPLDVVTARLGGAPEAHLIDGVTIPLVGSAPVEIATRTTNPVGVVEAQPDPTPTPPPPPGPGDPGIPDPGPGPTPSPGDGTQAAVLLNWGPVLDGDEFSYTGAPSAKWGMYNGAGHSGNGLRRPSAFSVANGIMTCYGDAGGTTGGMAFRQQTKYARIEWRARAYSVGTSGRRYHPVLIMWPTSMGRVAGGEYDHFETNIDSGELGWFLHYPTEKPRVQEGGKKPLDIQNWHNYAFEWSRTGLRGWCDGVKYFEYTDSRILSPDTMHVTFQLDNFFGGGMCPAKFEAQWFRVYKQPA